MKGEEEPGKKEPEEENGQKPGKKKRVRRERKEIWKVNEGSV